MTSLSALFHFRSEVKHFPSAIEVEMDLSSSDINVGLYGAQEWPPQDERRLAVDLHAQHHKIHWDKCRVPRLGTP